jgi:hypothetical protein
MQALITEPNPANVWEYCKIHQIAVANNTTQQELT